MVIILESDKKSRRGYTRAQIRYAITYVAITTVVLLILNFACSHISQRLFYESKEAAMVEKCRLTADEVSLLNVLNHGTVSAALDQMESLKVTRLIVTDSSGIALYDSADSALASYVLLPEVLEAINGNDVFSWKYHAGSMVSRAATPVYSGNTISGCVYMTENDTTQGALIQLLQSTVLQITIVLEFAVILFSALYSRKFYRRMNTIMSSLRIIQQGDYSHKVLVGGNDELTMLGDEFNDLTERLQTSEQKRSRFVSDASHELKTPLASIKLLTDSILQNEMDTETMREFVGDIGNEADRLNRMTAKLLSLTRADRPVDTVPELILISPTIGRVEKLLTPLAQKAGVSIQTSLEEDCPILILEDDLYQIVFNLMENGIKYNQPGGILKVILEKQEDNVLIQISDSGVGIPEDAVSHIFERFYRVDKARSRATGGTGLGLAIVRTIVLKNNGEITVESALGQGTCFTVSFPVFDAEVDR